MLESILSKVATLLKSDSDRGVFREYCEVFKNSFFYRAPPVAPFEAQIGSI